MTPRAPARRRRRRYDSPVRRQRAAETRERIVSAGAKLFHGFPVWNWRELTIARAAERAGVSERTVYRHFPTERELREAVLARLEEEAGVDLEGLGLADLRGLATRTLQYVSSFPLEPRTPRDATSLAAHARLREALVGAVAPATEAWPEAERAIAAAMIDVLWSVVSYERLVVDWGLEPEQAIRGVSWAIGLVEEAIRRDRRPGA